MKIYINYVLKTLAAPTTFITMSLVSVVWLTQSLKFIDLIINQGLPVYDFLKLIILLLPSLFGLVLPIAILCSTIYTYNKLNYESEILVLKAAGVSKFGIALPCVILAIMTTAIGYAVSFYFLPVSFRDFKDTQYYFRDNYASLMLEEGIFNEPISGLMVYVRSRDESDKLSGILIHDNREADKPVTIMAESAKAEKGPNGLRFLMFNASRQQVDKNTGEINILYFDSYPFDFEFYNATDNSRARKSDEMFVSELLNPDPKLDKKQRQKQIADGHNRIAWPMNNLSLPLMVLAMMLSGDFNRRGQSQRIIYCIILAIIIIASSMSFKNLAASGKTFAIPLIYAPNVLAILFSLYVLIINKNPFAKKIHRRLATEDN